jgi:putative spermidine/putrescine transport system substrate-binding protein
MGTSFAIKAAKTGLLAPYKVAEWKTIPSVAKTAKGYWYDDYGGYVAIGYTSSVVKNPPKSFTALLKSTYKNEVGINGNPTEAGAAFAAVMAASLANGGSFTNIKPGITYFKKLYGAGNYVPVTASEATAESHATPIIIWWTYLQASEVATKLGTWKVVIPSDGHYAAYYSQAINKTAPHPAAARLWEEYLYSKVGQNLWLQGFARPIELPIMVKNHTVTKRALAALPKAPPGSLKLPTQTQLTAAEKVVASTWATVTGS